MNNIPSEILEDITKLSVDLNSINQKLALTFKDKDAIIKTKWIQGPKPREQFGRRAKIAHVIYYPYCGKITLTVKVYRIDGTNTNEGFTDGYYYCEPDDIELI